MCVLSVSLPVSVYHSLVSVWFSLLFLVLCYNPAPSQALCRWDLPQWCPAQLICVCCQGQHLVISSPGCIKWHWVNRLSMFPVSFLNWLDKCSSFYLQITYMFTSYYWVGKSLVCTLTYKAGFRFAAMCLHFHNENIQKVKIGNTVILKMLRIILETNFS